MKRSRFTEEQIIAILREQEAGVPVMDLCRKRGLSSPTFYKWKAKYGGLDVSEARRLKALEDENAKLKRLLADAMLHTVALKDLHFVAFAAPPLQSCRRGGDGPRLVGLDATKSFCANRAVATLSRARRFLPGNPANSAGRVRKLGRSCRAQAWIRDL